MKGEAAAGGVDADNFYDNAVVALRFADGTIGMIDGICPADYGYDARVEVLGYGGAHRGQIDSSVTVAPV